MKFKVYHSISGSKVYAAGSKKPILCPEKEVFEFDGSSDALRLADKLNDLDKSGKRYVISERSDHCLIEIFDELEAPEHYDNTKGSLYKVSTERGWNAYLFDVVKRLERGGKKDPLKQEIEKSIFVLQLWLKEHEQRGVTCESFEGIPEGDEIPFS